MSLNPKEIRILEQKIIDGTIPQCPVCGERIVVGKKQEGESGAVGLRYRCMNHDCGLPPGHAYMPWYVVLFRALQKRAVQLALAAIGSITITGALGLATGVVRWKETDRPIVRNDLVYSKVYADSNDYLKDKTTGLFGQLTNAKSEVWFVGVTFHITLADGDFRNVILQKLAEGVTVKFLIFDPTSKNVEFVAKQYGRDETKNLFSDCETTIKYLSEIYETSKNRHLKANLEIKLYQDIPQSRLYIFDRNDPNNYTYFIPHVGKSRSGELPGFLFRNDSTLKEYGEAIISLWNTNESAGINSFETWQKLPAPAKWLAARNIALSKAK